MSLIYLCKLYEISAVQCRYVLLLRTVFVNVPSYLAFWQVLFRHSLYCKSFVDQELPFALFSRVTVTVHMTGVITHKAEFLHNLWLGRKRWWFYMFYTQFFVTVEGQVMWKQRQVGTGRRGGHSHFTVWSLCFIRIGFWFVEHLGLELLKFIPINKIVYLACVINRWRWCYE